jgi:amino acid adenylation domain-containing protein
MHHIISDGWSVALFLREMAALYEAYCEGKPSPLRELKIQYADYAVWQREAMKGEQLEEQMSYWKERLKGSLPVLQLPTDHARPPFQSFRGARQSFVFPSHIAEGVNALSERANVTVFMVLLSAFKTLLHRYSGQNDILVGTPIANRNRIEIESLIGLFVNTLVLRTDLSGDPRFRDLLDSIREEALGAYANQDLPIERLVGELQPDRRLSHTPLFQVMIAIQNVPRASVKLSGLDLKLLDIDIGASKFDLSLIIDETQERIAVRLEYRTDLFEQATIIRMLNHFQSLLESVIINPEMRLSALPLMNEAERNQLLFEWNDTKNDYAEQQTVTQLFEAQVERTPNALAVIFEQEQLTFAELNRRANQLARFLRGFGVKPETVVGICMDRSTEMIVGLLGILKAGGAYLPLDTTWPADRIRSVLLDVQSPMVLTQERLISPLTELESRLVLIDSDWAKISKEDSGNLDTKIRSENLAYVIFTSGSTGKPKGVMIQHKSVANLLAALYRIIYFRHEGSKIRVSINGPLAFDTSVKQIIQLLNGHVLVIVPQEIRSDGKGLLSYLQHHQLDVFDCTPSQLRLLISDGLLVGLPRFPKHLLVAGEAIDEASWQALRASLDRECYNLYGPTECTVDATVSRIQKGLLQPTIGRPVANTKVYILDPGLQPVPIGVVGELYIGGAGLARGYLNSPALTAERFMPDHLSGDSGARIYKTGDLARYSSDMNIQLLGRADGQVKIRGMRIELGEIEAILSDHQGVREAVVIVKEGEAGDKRLIAYVVTGQHEFLEANELRNFLREKLPDYMIPSAFFYLDQLPLTLNGKVDRARLPELDGARYTSAETFAAPRTNVERILEEIWGKLLDIDRVSVFDNFFDVGGHSLLATQLLVRLYDAFQVELPLRTLLENPTIAEQAAVIEEAIIKQIAQSAEEQQSTL